MELALEMSHDIDAFAPDWPSLAHGGASSHYVFQTSDVLKIWQRTIGAARRILPCYVRLASPSDETLILAALGIEERRGVKVLVALDGGVSDYNAPIVFAGAESISPASLRRYLHLALPAFDAAVLEKLPGRIGARPNPLVGEGARPANSFYAIDLAPDWQTFAATRLHRPKDSRRKRRRLAELGGVRLIVAETQAERKRLFAAFMRQKTARYIAKNGADGFERPGYRAYFAQMTDELHPRGHVNLSALEVAGEIVATHWGLVSGKRFYCLMLAYEACAAARYSVASLLVEELVKWSFANGLETFDLGAGQANWKNRFGAQRRALMQTEEAVSPLGWAYLNARRLRDKWTAAQPNDAPGVPLRGAGAGKPAEAI